MPTLLSTPSPFKWHTHLPPFPPFVPFLFFFSLALCCFSGKHWLSANDGGVYSSFSAHHQLVEGIACTNTAIHVANRSRCSETRAADGIRFRSILRQRIDAKSTNGHRRCLSWSWFTEFVSFPNTSLNLLSSHTCCCCICFFFLVMIFSQSTEIVLFAVRSNVHHRWRGWSWSWRSAEEHFCHCW